MRFKMMAAATMLFVVPAIAQTAPSSDAPASQPAKEKPAKEKKVCRRSDVPTGSILGGSVICHTKAEWEQVDEANARGADDLLRRTRTPMGAGSH